MYTQRQASEQQWLLRLGVFCFETLSWYRASEEFSHVIAQIVPTISSEVWAIILTQCILIKNYLHKTEVLFVFGFGRYSIPAPVSSIFFKSKFTLRIEGIPCKVMVSNQFVKKKKWKLLTQRSLIIHEVLSDDPDPLNSSETSLGSLKEPRVCKLRILTTAA